MIIINVGIKKEKNYYYFVIPRYEESIFKRIQNYFRFFLRQNDKFFASFPLLPSLLSSYIKSKVHDITVFNDVGFALYGEFPGLFNSVF